jgi:sigma-B regulation protein RsbU (phosphoserine phosphatase)
MATFTPYLLPATETMPPPLSAAAHRVTGPASDRPLTVLLIDDQPLIAETVRRMLAGEPDIRLHYCQDPTQALRQANEIEPTVILQDLVMPDVDGLTLTRFLRANPKTRDVPLIVLSSKEEPAVKAEAFARGANDYLVKLPDKIELIARIRHHSRGYIALLERNEAYQRLEESRRQLADEVEKAARYVRSLLPPPRTEGSPLADWRFVPSTQLGGDSFGYHWLDDDHFAAYLLDVSGHGVGASLLSVSAMNVITSGTLPNVDFRAPGQVLEALSAAFQMEKQAGNYFTIWYGVYQRSTRRLTYSGGGHPPAALIGGPTPHGAPLNALESQGPMIGIGMDLPYDTATVELPSFARLFLFSDGVFEIEMPDGRMWNLGPFLEYLSQEHAQPGFLDNLYAHVREMHGGGPLDDDFSIVQIEF